MSSQNNNHKTARDGKYWQERVQKLNELKTEYQKVEKRMVEIRNEVRETFAQIKAIAPEFDSSPQLDVIPVRVQRPRPVEDKLVIAAGRQIVDGLKNGLSKEETEAAALRAALKLGKKYGLDKVPESVVKAIRKNLNMRYMWAKTD